jgi:hypothetical protein
MIRYTWLIRIAHAMSIKNPLIIAHNNILGTVTSAEFFNKQVSSSVSTRKVRISQALIRTTLSRDSGSPINIKDS